MSWGESPRQPTLAQNGFCCRVFQSDELLGWVPRARTSHAGQGTATGTSDSPASRTPSCCLCYSLANLSQPLINTLLIPPSPVSPHQPFPPLRQLSIQRMFFSPCSSSNDKQMLVVYVWHNFPAPILNFGRVFRGPGCS